jgi:hypothetical protein
LEAIAMLRVIGCLSAIALGCTVVTPLRAEHAKINLEVSGPAGQVSASVDQTPPAWGKNPRPVLKVKANERIRINFLLTNLYPHKKLENVVVHFFIAPEKEPGQHDLPDLNDEVFTETAFEMDFKPGGKAGQRMTIRIDKPGVYLVRVETRNTQSDHEHFAAVDLVVGAQSAP